MQLAAALQAEGFPAYFERYAGYNPNGWPLAWWLIAGVVQDHQRRKLWRYWVGFNLQHPPFHPVTNKSLDEIGHAPRWN